MTLGVKDAVAVYEQNFREANKEYSVGEMKL